MNHKVMMVLLAVLSISQQDLVEVKDIIYPMTILSQKRIIWKTLTSKKGFQTINRKNDYWSDQFYSQYSMSIVVKDENTYLSKVTAQFFLDSKLVKLSNTYINQTLSAGMSYLVNNRESLAYCPESGYWLDQKPGNYTLILTFYDEYLRPNEIIGNMKAIVNVVCVYPSDHYYQCPTKLC